MGVRRAGWPLESARRRGALGVARTPGLVRALGFARVIVGLLVFGWVPTLATAAPEPGEAAAAARVAPPPGAGRVRVAASERYRAGRVHRFALGGGYRDLWQAPIELPVLDLAAVGGGLEPVGRFGGLQTAVLGLQGADGRSYTFRGTDKDPSAVLDPMLHDTLVQVIVQDQMAAQHPGGPPVAGRITEAAGVLTVHERMVVMPDDPRLGKYRDEFAGMVGTFFEFPRAAKDGRAGFAGAVEILDHEELYARLEAGPEMPVDVRAFLRARLVDLLLGDFDRHRKQWRWARIPGEAAWQPLPEDRDQAFVRYDGWFQRIMKVYIPILQEYGPDYPFVKGLTLHGWEQDRWLLPALAWSDWVPIVADVQARLTDEVIRDAVSRLPPEYEALDGERLRRDLAGRRDALPEVARRFYEHLAADVDVQLSDEDEHVAVERDADGRTRVHVRTAEDGRTIFERVFLPEETDEVRLYLRGGRDEVDVSGGSRGPKLRVIAGSGPKRVDDAAGGGTRVYDHRPEVEIVPGRWTSWTDEPYEPPLPDPGFVDVEEVPPRDWGSDTIPLPEFGFQPDVGVFLGGAVAHTRYGFRKHPWSSKHSLGFGWAFEANAPRIRYRGEFRPENSGVMARLDLKYSGIEVLRYYGLGNETSDRGNDRQFRVRNEVYEVGTSVLTPFLDDRIVLRGGPFLRVSRTFRGRRLIDDDDPYGNNTFGFVGFEGSFRVDTRESLDTDKKNLELPFHDNPAAGYPTSGILFDVTARISPALLDVVDPYGWISGSIAGFVSVGEGARATLGLRVGGMETFGPTPYFDLATIGGGRFFSGDATNRGFRSRRFYGDSSVFGNADLRIVLGRPKIIVPGDIGIAGFFDVGRVFYHDESSDEWHPSGGGGIWFSPLLRTNTISVSVADSPEDTLVYLRIGFHY